MWDHIPFDIQSEIVKRLPVKSLLQFRSVSKQCKSFIDNSKFIKNYHVNHPNPQHHLFVCYKLDTVQTYTSIIDNDTFPQQNFPLTAPESLRSFNGLFLLNSVDGLLCFRELYVVDKYSHTEMVVIWNPTVRKSVCIQILVHEPGYVDLGFGVSHDTNDPKLVKIFVDRISSMWVVEVFALSTRVWKTVYMGAPFKSCTLFSHHVFVDGVIYFRAYYNDVSLDNGVRCNIVISFDLKSDKFGEVCVPERLVHTPDLNVTKVNESLGLLEYHDEGGIKVCGVWSRKDGANNPFTKIYTIKVEGMSFDSVLGFRNNGDVVIKLDADDYNEPIIDVYVADDYNVSKIGVYEPLSGHTNNVGIYGKRPSLYAMSYTETLLLLDEADSIIH